MAFGAASFFENEQNQLYIGILGTVILLGFGLKYLLKPSYNTEKPLTLSATDFAGFFVKGFLVNFVNPFVFAVWIGIIGYGSGKFGKGEGVAIFLIGVLAGIFSIDLLKALLAHKIKKVLKPQYMVWVYRVSGILLIGFGIRMLIVVI